jgi:ADP-ribose pyrophosphatase YjhB (NUDIX family)
MTGPSPPQGHFRLETPPGDNRTRRVCEKCGWIDYVNPRIVVGSVATWEGRALLCRRAIEPRRGFWTIPAGFLEERETTEEGARREAREEANAEVELLALLAVYNIARISQVELVYKARLASPSIAPGAESLEVGLFDWGKIPWGELAFPSVRWALEQHRQVESALAFPPFTNPRGEEGGLPGL